MAKIAILLDTDFEQVEYTQTNDLLKAKGHQTTLITTQPQKQVRGLNHTCLLYTSPSPRDGLLSRMPSSA